MLDERIIAYEAVEQAVRLTKELERVLTGFSEMSDRMKDFALYTKTPGCPIGKEQIDLVKTIYEESFEHTKRTAKELYNTIALLVPSTGDEDGQEKLKAVMDSMAKLKDKVMSLF